MTSINAKRVSFGLFLAGCLSSFAFAPFNYFWLVYLLFPLLISCCFRANQQSANRHAFAFSLGWFCSGVSWIYVSLDQYGDVPLIGSIAMIGALAAYLSLYFTAAIALSRFLTRYSRFAIFTLPASWTFFEWLRSFVLTGFPWLSVGYSQIDSPFASLAPYIGEVGISFVLILLSCLLSVILFPHILNPKFSETGEPALAERQSHFFKHIRLNRASKAVSAFLLILFVSCLFPYPNYPQPEKQVKLALVQGNVAQENRWNPDYLWPVMLKYQDLSRPIYAESDIVIWPEAAVPAVEPAAQDYLINLDKAAAFNHTAVVTGIINYEYYTKAYYNSVIVLGNQNGEDNMAGHYQYGHSNRYNKHHLLPIGEFIPFEDWLRGIAPIFDLPFSSFNRGDYIQPDLVANGFHMTTALCYEIVFPRQIRANLKPNTDFILTLSNDAWFGSSHGPHQHLEIAQMRALEMGLPVVRVTNNGITAVIDHLGQIKTVAPQFSEQVLKYQLELVNYPTLYRQYGDKPVYWMAIILFGLSLAPTSFRNRKLTA
ncbi:apolipoprotein N-acyltransferase [Catenovulum sp. 2E275]|uniref:apolipoprotein N-acyltransferase n=1 Tax=Catenovulum sp. 2E275 TaxID=2980497 RepID=UPI0021D3A5C4|nr:apolipoprotein N-acyltransferase [Catenovulum sp. 2E275]MCU4675430.1 apolipoprotein N-acyltransferase [Catenovulum sp. 2E275]